MSRSTPPLSFLGATALAAGLGLSAGASALTITDLAQGYQVAAAPKHAEGKCGEGKCGAQGKHAEGKCGSAGKQAEGKCGGHKGGKDQHGGKAAKQAGAGKSAEGKCGEGKCGGTR